ncbi:hypothetical protein EVAR_64982_1 [Eumeta japonica]|nr:hypothetical protein EVAR_64982_1 [Eumeta japonica]
MVSNDTSKDKDEQKQLTTMNKASLTGDFTTEDNEEFTSTAGMNHKGSKTAGTTSRRQQNSTRDSNSNQQGTGNVPYASIATTTNTSSTTTPQHHRQGRTPPPTGRRSTATVSPMVDTREVTLPVFS